MWKASCFNLVLIKKHIIFYVFIQFVLIFFGDQAPPQAKVKKRRTIKQVLKEKEEKANEEALLREQENQLQKEVGIIVIVMAAPC